MKTLLLILTIALSSCEHKPTPKPDYEFNKYRDSVMKHNLERDIIRGQGAYRN